jgi:TRAP-type mannitol/chloroaromatic compound transport system permease small subunit
MEMTIPRLKWGLLVAWAVFIGILMLFLLKYTVPIEITALMSLLFIVFFVWLPLSTWTLGARDALVFTRTITMVFDRLYFILGYVCGLELLMLGFFITYQVVARKLEWVQAPGTDVMSGYVLAMAATWAFSYSLRSGAHVRIDVLLPYMGAKTRGVADWAAMGAVLFLGWVTMWKMWETVVNNYSRGVVTNDYPLTPLFIPKTVVAIGFTLLCVTAIHMMYMMVAEAVLTNVNRLQGGEEIETLEVIQQEAAGAAD